VNEPTAESTTPPADKKSNKIILIGIGAFIGTCVLLLVMGILIGPNMGQSEPGFPIAENPVRLEDGSHRVTLMTADKEVWVPYSLELGRIVPDGAMTDLRIRRYQFQIPRGAVDLGEGALTNMTLPPTPSWKMDSDLDGVLVNPAIERWYKYSYMSHLLSSKHHNYAIQLASGKTAFVQVLSYYCEPEGSGCLTLNYRIQ
jgi:hypothetical protein